MSVEAGQTLGKYQLIEKVGQGGMAVVYRGHDTSLNREVAVKVLHNHLAEHKEARERFGREAHAVAKLRHENILEIYDFSGLDSDETFIVTEFIEGCTLKEFICEHPLLFPETGALIVAQVCGALAHAHGLGVLHRDVKPENIMIRNDGVLKLTDFGIAQMIDLQRMTVTGQLLGSPAYMAPEHVLGGILDFRTDVFALGIVLYQLVTAELPFHGKNPHEILKRVADCEYPDPARKDPRVGKELGNIIRTALQKNPDDRYADISLMQQELETYLEGSGLQNGREELERFFDAPAAYQMALEQRLIAHLAERARRILPKDRNAALELYNRILNVDEDNAEVLTQIRLLGNRQRNFRVSAALLAALALAGLAVIAKSRFAARPGAAPDAAVLDATATVPDAKYPDTDGAIADAASTEAAPPLADASATPTSTPDARTATTIRRKRIDAAVAAIPSKGRSFDLRISRKNSEYRIGNGLWVPTASGRVRIKLGAGDQQVAARDTSCCEEMSQTISADDIGGPIKMNLRHLPGQLTPRCSTAGVSVTINDKNRPLGLAVTIPIKSPLGTERVKVTFFSKDQVDEQQVRVPAKGSEVVTCRF
ncbi:MAG: protein kinase [Myxococcales bacterium]|nr:protein kinase [Myxococcales bacterium]